MSVDVLYRWHDGSLEPFTETTGIPVQLLAADSWLVTEGRTLALSLHRDRFLAAVADAPPRWAAAVRTHEPERFWDAALAALPTTGSYFPRVELQLLEGGLQLVLRLRNAPAQQRSVVVATLPGEDPRTSPTIKGPDLSRMAEARHLVHPTGAGEAIILTADGFVVEGAYSGLLWWRGDILCSPPLHFERIDSVTVRSVLGLAAALGVETYNEAVTPAELEGTELWALSALHGARIVTSWVDGPEMAERPGRLEAWRRRLGALRQPV